VWARCLWQGLTGAVLIAVLWGGQLASAASARKDAQTGQSARGRTNVKEAGPKEAPTRQSPGSRAGGKEAKPTDLAGELDAALMPAGLKATVGACVVEVPSGRVIYEHNADEPLTPASNMKLLTTAVALDQLGADHRLRTRLLRNGDTLALVGGADPAFGDPNIAERLGIDRTADYAQWVKALQACGTAGQIRNLTFDDSILDSQWRHPSWSPKEYQHWYCAPVGGLVLNDSCVDVAVEPADGRTTPILLPPCSLFQVINKSTVGKGGAVVVSRPQDGWQLIVSGRCSGRTRPSSVTVPDPGMFAASVLYDMLKGQCCPEIQPPRREKITDQAGDVPAGWEVVGTAESQLTDVLQRCNTDSQNLFAEMLMKLNGAVATGCPGSWANGRLAVAQFLRRHDLPAEGVYVDDGSGLSAGNRVTARLLALLLCRMRERTDWDTWRNSLAVGGDSGTLRRRFRGELENKVFGKTGYINGVSSLSGYIEVRPEQYVAFSFIYNNVSGRISPRQAQDNACRVLYRQIAGDKSDE